MTAPAQPGPTTLSPDTLGPTTLGRDTPNTPDTLDIPRGDLLTPLWMHPRRLPALSVRQWERLLGQARQSRTLARLAQLCVDLNAGNAVPPGAWPHLQGGLSWVERQAHEVLWEIDCIQRALAGVDTPVVLLKGAAYLVAGLPAARGRLFNDIDILVDRRQLHAVEVALMGGGWLSAERDAYNQRYYREWQHELPPLEHVTRHTFIDVHHTITAPTSAFAVDGLALMSRIKPLESGDGKADSSGSSKLFVLDPLDMVLHSAAHLFQEGEFDHGLRDLLDLDDLLRHFANVDTQFWPALLHRAAELRLQVPLYHALHHVQRLFGTAAPAALQARISALQPNALSRVVMGWLLGRALRPMHPSCEQPLTGLARAVLYLRAHWLRMPLHLLLPHLARKAWMRVFPADDPNPTITA